MKCEEFVRAFKEEMDFQMNDYFSEYPKTVTGTEIKKLDLSQEQVEILKLAIDACLSDTYYTVLLGLDGSGIGSMQHMFKVFDESNTLVYESGELEAEAYEQFQRYE